MRYGLPDLSAVFLVDLSAVFLVDHISFRYVGKMYGDSFLMSME